MLFIRCYNSNSNSLIHVFRYQWIFCSGWVAVTPANVWLCHLNRLPLTNKRMTGWVVRWSRWASCKQSIKFIDRNVRVRYEMNQRRKRRRENVVCFCLALTQTPRCSNYSELITQCSKGWRMICVALWLTGLCSCLKRVLRMEDKNTVGGGVER